MTPTRTTASRMVTLALAGVGLVTAGAGAMYMYLRDRQPSVQMQTPSPGTPLPSVPGDIVIALTPEGITRAGIRTARPTVGQVAGTVIVPGVVEPFEIDATRGAGCRDE